MESVHLHMKQKRKRSRKPPGEQNIWRALSPPQRWWLLHLTLNSNWGWTTVIYCRSQTCPLTRRGTTWTPMYMLRASTLFLTSQGLRGIADSTSFGAMASISRGMKPYEPFKNIINPTYAGAIEPRCRFMNVPASPKSRSRVADKAGAPSTTGYNAQLRWFWRLPPLPSWWTYHERIMRWYMTEGNKHSPIALGGAAIQH